MTEILLTGASGYIGGHLKESLKQDYEIVAISRNIDNKKNENNVTWKSADLFALNEISNVMEGVDTAIYLVHSMMPSAKLTQANFEDMDALLADNFARAAKANGVKHIIFMSGLIPKTNTLSPHLRSRLECEKILGSYDVPVSTLRAGLIIGSKGSSYPILKKLVERLPMLVLPSWAYNTTLPVAIEDIIDGLVAMVKRSPEYNESIDIGGPEHMTYKDLFRRTSNVLEKPLPMVDLPIIPIWLSKYWVKLISGTPKEMLYPLMDSLVHDMNRNKTKTVEDISIGKVNYEESVEKALEEEKNTTSKKGKSKKQPLKIKDVRAITRIDIPREYTISDIESVYANFLKRFTFNVIEGEINDNYFGIKIPFLNKMLFLLEKDHDASDDNRILYRIIGGDFSYSNSGGNASLEFRRILDTDKGLVALQEYQPTLPWLVYKLTQAKLHKSVMNLFANKMSYLANNGTNRTDKMCKIVKPIVIASVSITLFKKYKKYLARRNKMSNAEL
ncbi:NAD(P)H-binding protein [Staphylococcus equorum]|uniref:NAD(P)H-binding protein n=1 Tax=Staphylococcus equorum TaxID=246432 RepID=A0A9X4L959_9STAP|nr:NAD(P)H-binding protein [Staphylococcus equorum]MDG0842937.1 NAD(P)H-binding protein [Staphylococcus equorum]MDG0859441.1 NAD(P)H-binding protein [Staphylococcus equorum]